jgi:Zn-dependent peptidase ImmA (M78 family)/DNA-binding Xre family transcriptional regulator
MATDNPSSPFAMRLKQARLLRDFSLRDLSEKMQNAVSHVSLAKYEQGQVKPSGEILAKLCSALEVSPEFFFRPVRVSLDAVSFRKRKSFNENAKSALLEHIRLQLENYIEAEEILGAQVKFHLDLTFPAQANPQEARLLAHKLRIKWGLDEQPIPSLVDLLEKKGVRIVEVDEPTGQFDGAQINGVAAIAVGKHPGQSMARKRFTIAHEFGHLVLDAWAKKHGLDEKALEKVAHAFASEFLLPSAALKSDFGQARTSITLQELSSASLKYGMSVCGIVYALREIGIVGESAFKRFQMYTVNSWRKDGQVVEPDEEKVNCAYPEEPRQFQRIVLRGVAEGHISLSRGAGLLGTDISALRKEAVPVVE